MERKTLTVEAETRATGSQATEPQAAQPSDRRESARKAVVYGYARVSARDQNLARQIDALLEFGVKRRLIYEDRASGRDFDRPGFRRLMRRLRAGDVVVVKSIDRLGRCYSEILEQWRVLTKERGVDVVVLDMPLLDTRTRVDGVTGAFLADVVLQLLSYVAQVERDNIRQRQAEGIAAAHARGVRFGRPRLERPEPYGDVLEGYLAGLLTRKEASAALGVSTATFDRWKREDLERRTV
nr:recombinase family protein [Adlercreutzia sp. ZJ473]